MRTCYVRLVNRRVLVKLDACALGWREIGTLPELTDADTAVALSRRLAHLVEASDLGEVEWARQ